MRDMDVWEKLWDAATGEPGDPAVIELDPEDPYEVGLRWPDGSVSGLYWYEGEWRHHEYYRSLAE